MSKWINKWIIGALIVAALLVAHLIEENHDATVPMGEVIGLDEDKFMAAAVASSLNMMNNTREVIMNDSSEGKDPSEKKKPSKDNEISKEDKKIYRRDVHIKSHGCLRATFSVPDDLERKYRWGVFEKPDNYDAWIRYSNGDYTYKRDRSPDARGMAIKLMGVEGEQLLPSQKGARTQDFVMMNSKNYFIRELKDYIELTQYLAKNSNFGYFLNGPSWNPFTWRLRELKLVGGTKKNFFWPLKSIINTQFWSASAYRLGPEQNIKFSAKAVDCKTGKKAENPTFKTKSSHYNYLRGRLKERLKPGQKLGPACFDFMVQMQVPGKNMPVEDATIVWDEDDAPFKKVARIKIPLQDFDTPEQNNFCENLSFNPWHGVHDHKPIGVFNRVRKALYTEVARYRYAENKVLYRSNDEADANESSVPPILQVGEPPEPEDWCIDEARLNCGSELLRESEPSKETDQPT
ncbi:MAG: catalase family protein [Woeseiaceae bacterium]